MIVAAHQPTYLPWLGLFDKMAKADVFLVLDDVPYEPHTFHCRSRVKHEHGEAWLSVPLLEGGETLLDKHIDNFAARHDEHWQRHTWLTLVHAYRRAPYFARYIDDLRFVYTQPWRRLVDLDLYLIDLARRWFDIRTPVVRSSTLELAGGDTTARLVEACGKLGARAYLAGEGTTAAQLDTDRMARAGIGVVWQHFAHPTYPQQHAGFTPNLAFLDILFNCGDASRKLLFDAGHPIHASAPSASVLHAA